MAVYEHTYRPYAGSLTPAWSRFLIIPRHAYGDIFKSKLFAGFFVLCYVPPLIMAILIYLHYNVSALALLEIRLADLLPINAVFFQAFVTVQGTLAFLLSVLIGPVLVSRDLANNGLPLYLCRPFSRGEYVLGKLSVLLIMTSAVTWVPLMLCFLLHAYLKGDGWFTENLWIGWAVFFTSCTWIIVLALLSVTLSAWIKWRTAASAGMFAVFMIPSVIGVTINQLFNVPWGSMINLGKLIATIGDSLFRQRNFWNPRTDLPLWAAWFALAAICCFCLFLLTRKVRAYEVVR
jgi:ABC-2 type transport system permease protein